MFDDVPGLRPTPSRVRETLFNWLQADIVNSRCLDLYAGSGALGIEAASRGAREVVQVESHATACQKLRANIDALSASQIRLVAMDVGEYLQGDADGFDLVFLDPPFGKNLVSSTCWQLERKGWLNSFAKVYVETERNLTLRDMPSNWRQLKNKSAGEVAYYLFQRQST